MRNVRASFLVSAVVGTAVATRVAFLPAGHDTVCGAQGYHGTVGPASSPYRVYVIPDSCSLEIGSASSIPDTHVLVHVQRAKADVRLLGDDWSYPEELHSFLRRAATNEFASQAPLDPHHVLQLASFFESTVVAVPEATLEHLDAILPRFLSATVLQSTPVVPVAHSAVQSLRRTIEHVTYSKHVASLVETLNVTEIYNDLTYLSGEDPGSPILERNSLSAGARVAADWLQGQFEDSGATCEQVAFRDGWAPNVLCDFEARDNGTGVLILGAHYDSRGRPFPDRAPGADDDGSGTAHLLALARAIKRLGISFDSRVRFAAFAGEEQGLVGSRAYAKLLREQDASVTLMIQADMLAYHDPLEPMQLGQPDSYSLPEANELVAKVSGLYAPELMLGWTGGCCTDHQSFTEQGFPATSVFERGLDGGGIVDPMYHTSFDLVNRTGIDLEQLRSISKVVFATLLHTVGYHLPEEE